MITFSNPGKIDIRLITTLGVNVKESDNPIGYFGTGLKYAIAVLLREKQKVEIWSGTERIAFEIRPDTVRGKSFGFIWLGTARSPWQCLGFTTELGKNWTLENAYRELYSNCMDEGGSVSVDEPQSSAETTNITVRGSAFDKVHRERFSFLLDPIRPKLASDGSVEIYAGRADHIFYKGIAAFKLTQPSTSLYNIIAPMVLTEDRTISSHWTIEQLIGATLLSSAPRHILEAALTTKPSYENTLNFSFCTPSDAALDILEDLIRTSPMDLHDEAPKILSRYRKRDIPRDQIEFNPAQRIALDRTLDFWLSVGYPIGEYDIRLAADLGRRVIALAEGTTIWLTDKAFVDTAMLRSTLLEEFFHLRFRVGDLTREMQNVLFAEMTRLAKDFQEKVNG